MKKFLLGILLFLALAGAAFAAGFDAIKFHEDEKTSHNNLLALVDKLRQAKLETSVVDYKEFRFEDYLKALPVGVSVEQAQQKYAANVAAFQGILAKAESVRTTKSAGLSNYLLTQWALAGQNAKRAGDQLTQKAEFDKLVENTPVLKDMMKPATSGSLTPSPTTTVASAPFVGCPAPMVASEPLVAYRPNLVLVTGFPT